MPKTKISKPILWGLILVVVVGIWALLNPAPTTTTAPKRVLVSSSQTATGTDANGITQADLDTHFAHYTGGARDPFVPRVLVLSAQDQAGAQFGKAGEHGAWALTGINSINGVPSAVIENGTTGDSVFLEPGDHWNGLKVASIGSDTVVFQNALGQQTPLTFSVPDDKQNGPNGQNIAPMAVPPSAIPSLSAITPLPALPALDPSAQPQMQFRRRGRGRRGSYGNATSPAQQNESSNE